jgi:insulysin
MYLVTIVWPLLQSNVSALIDMKLEKYKNIREESAFFWGEISEGTLKFDRKQEEVCTH